MSCLLCGSRESTPYLVGRDRLLGRSREYTIVRCCGCGFRYLWPRPHSSEFGEHYPAEYFPYHTPVSKLSDRASHGPFGRFKWRMDCVNLRRMGYPMDGVPPPGSVELRLAPLRWTKLQHTILPPRGRCRMLDIGCGSGLFLYRHKDLGWETWGVEKSPVAGELARGAGLRVITEPIETADLPQGYFDVIVMLHVLEHLENPVGLLARLRPLLAPGGQLIIEVPCADSWGLRFWGTYWFFLDLPRHLSHFGRADLTRLVAATGYRIVRHLTRSESEWHASSLDYWLEDHGWPRSMFRERGFVRRTKLHRKLGSLIARSAGGEAGDALRVWLEPIH